MAVNVDSLQIEIGASSSQAAQQIDALASSLKNLKSSVNGGATKQIKSLSESLRQLGKTAKGSFMGGFIKSIGRIAMYRAMRSAIKAVTTAIREGTENAYNYSKAVGGELAAAYDHMASTSFKMKNQLGSAWTSLIQSIMPAIESLIAVVTRAADALAQLFAILGGRTTYLKATDYVKEWGDQAKKSAGGAAKALKDYTLGIDELNVINDKNGGGGGGAAGLDYENMFEEAAVNSKFQPIADMFTKLKNTVEKHIDDIELILAGAALAVGAVLTFTGANIPLGLGLMAYGAYKIGKAIFGDGNWMTKSVQEKVADIELIVGGAMLALGAILAFSGANIPLGIALMATGALSIAHAAAQKWDEIPSNVKRIVSDIQLAVGGAFLALGAVLAFSGANIPLGIGLMVLGAVSIASALITDWNSTTNKVRKITSDIQLILGGAMLVLGGILTFSGANVPLGIGLMVAGAASIAAGASINWDTVKEKVKTVVSAIAAILSGALIVLGVLLILSGAGIGLGLAVLAAGLAGSYAAWTLDDNPITRFVKKMANGIIGIINTVIDAINELFHISFSGLSILGEEIIPAFDVRLVNLRHIATFAEGGIVDSGTLFIAGEAGPEMVGTIGGQTGVANNDQIVEGIAEGVASANSEQNALLRQQNELLTAILARTGVISISGKEIRSAYDKANIEAGARIMPGGVFA